jgi:hypothetical protein
MNAALTTAATETHARLILEHLIKYGSITQAEAAHDYGCWRLGARIWDLRADGIEIETEMVKEKNRFGKDVRFAKYSLKKKEEKQA